MLIICCMYVFIFQRFTKSCVPKGRSLTFCPSLQSLHPLSSPDCHQVEAYRASKRPKMSVYVSVCVCIYLLYWKMTPCDLCVLQKKLHYFCLLSTKRHTQAPTAKCMYKLYICPILYVRRHVISLTMLNILTFIFFTSCLSRVWEAPEKSSWILCPRIHGGTVINFNIKTIFFMCAI